MIAVVNKKIYSFLKSKSWFTIGLAIVIFALFNSLLSAISEELKIPLYLDSIFTAVSAAIFGVIPGITTGLFTNLFMEVIHGIPMLYYPFAVVNMATGIAVGVLVKYGYFRSYLGVFMVILITVLVNALLGTLVVTIVYGGISSTTMEYLVRVLIMSGRSVLSAAFLSRLLINLVDKGIAVLIAFIVYSKVRL